jgi:hypothetical protein
VCSSDLTDTSTSAVVINAGRDASAGDATGGDVRIGAPMSITTGTGGRYTLYTGSLPTTPGNGTELDQLLGSGSGRYRYHSDESTTNFSTALGSGGYAIYRAQPTVDVAAADVSKTYDGQAYSGGGGLSSSGWLNGDTNAALSGTPSYGGNAQGATSAGSYTLSVSGLANGLGYALNLVDGTLTVDKAALTVTAGNTGKTYDGQAFSGHAGVAYSGFVTGDNAANSLSGSLAYGGTAQGAVNAGSYSIVPSGLSAANYSISYANGTLTVSPRPITVTADDKTKVYGNADPALSWQVTTGSLVGNDTLSGTLTRASGANVGSYAIDASALANGNYAVTAVDGTLTVTPRPITVTADDKTKVYEIGRAHV